MEGANKVELILNDICYPDYYRGTSDFSLAVSLHPEMTKEEMSSAINDSVQQCMDFPFDYEVFETLQNEWVDRNHCWVIRDLSRFPEETWTMDDGYYPYAYFSVREFTPQDIEEMARLADEIIDEILAEEKQTLV